VVQRLRCRYAKRGRLRFVSHRDFARSFERALRRAATPMAYSAGFSPHPRISYVGAAPTGVASEAEYVEIGLAERVEPAALARALDAALPAGLDVVELVEAGPGKLADRIEASRWRIELSGAHPEDVRAALGAFLGRDEVPVERLTKNGRRSVDPRAALVSASVVTAGDPPCAIIEAVVRHVTPAVRPDDVLSGLHAVADLKLPEAPRATRLAQGSLDEAGGLADPLAADRVAPVAVQPS
jgi:radical SAM-linked protein